jgi:hypothetical protein
MSTRVVSRLLLAGLLVALPSTVLAEGWYLLMPPITAESFEILAEAPLHQWRQVHAYDTAEQCETSRRNAMSVEKERSELKWHARNADPADRRKSQELKRAAAEYIALVMVSRCVSASDPRLAPGPR